MFALTSFLMHPIQFWKDWRAYRRAKATEHNKWDYHCTFWTGDGPDSKGARCFACRPVKEEG